VPDARVALDRIVRDEVRHRDFGWTLLDVLLDAPELRELAAREVPRMLAERREPARKMGASRKPPLLPAERAWGLLDDPDYLRLFERCLARDIAPRLCERGLPDAPADG
jgi:hypothetical protein